MRSTQVSVSAGASHSACLYSGHPEVVDVSSDSSVTPAATTLYTWGQGEDGQLGHRDSEDTHYPKEVDALQHVRLATICCGANHTIAVSAGPERELYAWGWGDFGRLGQGDPGDRLVPTPVSSLSGIVIQHVACGDSHCLVVAEDGKLFTFGRNQNGQLGLGDTEDRLKPTPVASLWADGVRVMKAAGGAEHSAITADGGTMYTFGWGRYGNLGHGHTRDLHVPTRVEGLEGQMVTDPICGWRHSAALTDQGRLWTFGWSKYGQLGHGDNIDHWSPKILPEFAGGPITAAAGGWRHMCALAGSSGTLYSWGWNQFGQLGIGSTEDSNAPRKVVVGTAGVPVSAVACGWRHTIAVAGEGGDVYAWGRCTNGQLGHGDTTQRDIPTKIEALDLLRQGLSVKIEDGLSLPTAHTLSGALHKRKVVEQDDLEVPTASHKKTQRGRKGFAAVPDTT